MVWLSFAEIVFVVVVDIGNYIPHLVPIHIIVGVALILLAAYNSVEIEKTQAPKRIGRISKAAMMMAIGAAVTGVMRAFIDGYVCFISFIHVTFIIAMITQASSAATAYDMWEEKEFLRRLQQTLGDFEEEEARPEQPGL
jgi:hypothetical protein